MSQSQLCTKSINCDPVSGLGIKIGLHNKNWDSLLARAPDSWSKGCEFESRRELRENFLLEG